ncbi:MAG: VWA domain-containing protein [Myxococcota bacterium]|nr:VWA domain-containing protein [Myxococcota bacterium]
MSFSVGWGLALWGLAAVPLLLLLGVRSRFALSARRRWLAGIVRAAVVALVVLSVADLRITWPTSELAVAAVIDGSTAIAPEERHALERELAAMQQTHPDTAMRIAGARQQGSRDDVATRLSAAVATMPRDRVRRVLLATDGRDPAGDLPAAIDAAHRAGVEVSVLPIGGSPPIDSVAISSLEAPRLVRAAETLDVSATLHAATPRHVRLEAFLDGRSVATTEVDVPAGSSTRRIAVAFPEEPGVHELEVLAHADGITLNDRWRSLVEVLPKPRVRIHADPSRAEPALARVLRESGMEVDVAPPTTAFTELTAYDPYALVIADEIALGDLSEPQQRTMRRWVEEQGGGLITVTGAQPVRRTPRILREIEPIEPPPALPEPRPLELVIVIDRSSSMSGAPMEQARRAGVAAVRALRRDALVGSVAFSSEADRVQAPVPMDHADTVIGFIQGLNASGGTNIAAAVQAANRIMSNDPRYIHHVILVSDGESEPQSAIAAAMSLAGRGVSISTITIGSYSQLLAEIARIGRGRYHTTSAAGLTSLVVSEAMYRQPPAHRQVSFRPREQTHLAMLDGVSFDSAPPLTGHALASARRGATVALTATEGMPLLAHWHRGLGQVATFTSATSGGWADQLRAWPGFRTFWSSLARGMLRNRTIEPPRIAIEADPLREDVRLVTVTSPFAAIEPAPIVRLFRERGAGQALELAPRGPGVWQAELPVGFTFLVDARMPFDPEPTAAAGDEQPFPVALRAFGPELASLERLAAIGGGRVLEAPLGVLELPGEAEVMRPLRTPLLLAALLFYLASLLLLRMPDRRLASGLALERPSRIPVPARGRPSLGPSPASPDEKEEAA